MSREGNLVTVSRLPPVDYRDILQTASLVLSVWRNFVTLTFYTVRKKVNSCNICAMLYYAARENESNVKLIHSKPRRYVIRHVTINWAKPVKVFRHFRIPCFSLLYSTVKMRRHKKASQPKLFVNEGAGGVGTDQVVCQNFECTLPCKGSQHWSVTTIDAASHNSSSRMFFINIY